MDLIASAAYWFFGSCIAIGFGAIGFSWEQMRQQLNHVLPSEQRVPMFPPPAKSLEELVWKTNALGHFLDVLDRYRKTYPSSVLPKRVAMGVVAWILCFMGLLASGIGH
jgi:hypothetical protein